MTEDFGYKCTDMKMGHVTIRQQSTFKCCTSSHCAFTKADQYILEISYWIYTYLDITFVVLTVTLFCSGIYSLFTYRNSSSKVLCKSSNPWKCQTWPQSTALSDKWVFKDMYWPVCHTSQNCASLFLCSRQLMTMQWQREWSLAWGELNDAQRWGC